MTAALPLAWSQIAAFPVAVALLFPICLLTCLMVRALFRFEDPTGARALIGATLINAAAPFVAGALLANLLLIDGSLQRATLAGYALSACIGAAVGYLAINPTRRLLRRLSASVALQFRDIVAIAAGLLGVLLGLIDAMVWPDRYWNAHMLLLLGTVLSFSTMTVASASRTAIARVWLSISILLGIASLPPLFASGLDEAASLATSHFTAHRRLVLLARSLADGDHDGFSPALGGGDCDDTDPRAFPLSLVGRDCLSWSKFASMTPTSAPLALHATSATPLELAPRLVLLVTIDAFRCGMGKTGSAPLRDACPNITRLGREGKNRDDAHTTYPATRRAFGSLHSGMPCFDDQSSPQFLLARWMAANGYDTRVVSTHENQLPGALRSSFESIDESLLARASQPTATTAEQVTDRGLALVTDVARGSARPLFLWLHYFDAHAPYAGTPDASLVTEPEIRRYAREVARIDKAVSRLTQELRQRSTDTLVLLTADHGEEFGEMGFYRHGSSINEEAVRIPMIVWSPSPALLERLPETLPANNAEVSAFLVAALSGRPFVSSNETFFWVHSFETVAFGIYSAGKKLTYNATDNRIGLFDLRSDPNERKNLITEKPNLVAELAPKLISHLRRCNATVSMTSDTILSRLPSW